MKINWSKVQFSTAKFLDGILVFGAGALLDPNVSKFIGTHQGVATGVAIGIGVLRALDKAFGGKAATVAVAVKSTE